MSIRACIVPAIEFDYFKGDRPHDGVRLAKEGVVLTFTRELKVGIWKQFIGQQAFIFDVKMHGRVKYSCALSSPLSPISSKETDGMSAFAKLRVQA